MRTGPTRRRSATTRPSATNVTAFGYGRRTQHRAQAGGGDVIVLADGSAWPTGDALSPLVDALRDPSVAVVGGFGLTAGQAGPLQPTALETLGRRSSGCSGSCLDCVPAGRSDQARTARRTFRHPGLADVWWSLRLRAGQDPDIDDTVTETEDQPSIEVEAETAPSDVSPRRRGWPSGSNCRSAATRPAGPPIDRGWRAGTCTGAGRLRLARRSRLRGGARGLANDEPASRHRRRQNGGRLVRIHAVPLRGLCGPFH